MKSKRDTGIRPVGKKKATRSKSKPAQAKDPERMSTRSLKSKLEKELLAEKQSIQERLESIQIEPSENGGDFGDMSSALSDEGMKMIERDRLLNKLSAVNMVISRIHNNPNFANCDDCGDEIELKRLLFMPTARRCVYCQQVSER
jgi:RNA polymerase-binding transcription factor DksA